jgi:hypothetical protein
MVRWLTGSLGDERGKKICVCVAENICNRRAEGFELSWRLNCGGEAYRAVWNIRGLDCVWLGDEARLFQRGLDGAKIS